jgi:hypothetical protein
LTAGNAKAETRSALSTVETAEIEVIGLSTGRSQKVGEASIDRHVGKTLDPLISRGGKSLAGNGGTMGTSLVPRVAQGGTTLALLIDPKRKTERTPVLSAAGTARVL